MAGKSAPTPQREGVVIGLQVRLLGPVEVTCDGHRVRLPGAKPTALLALLAIHAGEVVETDRLVDGLWGDRPPRSAGAVLRTYVAQLRRVLGAAAIETRPAGMPFGWIRRASTPGCSSSSSRRPAPGIPRALA